MAVTPTKIGGFVNSGSTSSASIVNTLTAGASVGDDVWCLVFCGGGKTLSSVTDNSVGGPNTWTVDKTLNNGASVGVGIAHSTLTHAFTSGKTITATLSGAAIPRFGTIATTAAGVLASSPLDTTASATGSSTGNMSTGPTATLAQADELIIGQWGWLETVAGTTFTADKTLLDSGVSENAGAAGRGGGSEYTETAATTAVTLVPSHSTNGTTWVGVIATYKVAGSTVVNGTAAGSVSFTGAATGTVTHHVTSGTAAGTITITGAGAGTVTHHQYAGTAAGSITITGAATGSATNHLISGTAAGSITITGAATGAATRHQYSGTAAGVITITGAGTGTVTHHHYSGTAASTVTITGAATGTASHHVTSGTAATTITITGAATGTASHHLYTGTAAGVVTITIVATGTVVQAADPVPATPSDDLTEGDYTVIRQKIITLSPSGSDGSATATGRLALSRPGILRFLQVNYTSQASTTDLLIKRDTSSGATMFTATNVNTSFGPVALVTGGVDASDGAVTNVIGMPFSNGLYFSIAQANNSVSGAKDIVCTCWIEF